MKIVIVEFTESYPNINRIPKLFSELKIPDVVFVFVPKEAEIGIADVVDV